MSRVLYCSFNEAIAANMKASQQLLDKYKFTNRAVDSDMKKKQLNRAVVDDRKEEQQLHHLY